MTFEKLTYRAGTSNSYLYFGFYGDFDEIDLITKELNLEPTRAKSKGSPIPKKSYWSFHIDAKHQEDLRDEIDELVDLFMPKCDAIISIKKKVNAKTRLVFVLDVDINPKESTPCFTLSERTIEFLARTKSMVDFDLYKVDSIGVFDKL